MKILNKYPQAIKLAIPFAIIAVNIQTLYAADGVALTDEGLELTVTANRRPEDVNKALAPVTVITSKDIEVSQATTLAEVLTSVPGINIVNSGGIGKSTSVAIRGTGAKHVLVLIDGVRHGSATLGTTAFQYLPIHQIDRIEVVRGPRSSIYGSEAIGGVIQIFTHKGNNKASSPELAVSMGSNDTLNASLSFSGGNDRTWHNFNIEQNKTKGIDAKGDYYNPPTFSVLPETDKDGFRSTSISLNVGHKLTDSLTGEVSILRVEGKNEYDGFTNEAEFVQQAISSKLIADVSDSLNLVFSVGQSRDESEDINSRLTNPIADIFNTKRDTASLIADYSLSDSKKLLLGFDWSDAVVSGTTAFDATSRSNKGLFAGYSATYGKTQFDASLRQDDDEQFGSKTTGGIAVGYNINDSLRAKFSFGTAFKAPTFNDLYYPDDGSYKGNPNMRPETSKNIEIGFDGVSKLGKWEVNLFENKIKDLIAYSYQGVGVSSFSENLDKALIRGIESSLKSKLGAFDLSLNGILQEPEVVGGSKAGNILAKRPKQVLNLGLDRKFDRLRLGANIHAESKRYTSTSNTSSMSGFARLDIRASYDVSKDWAVGLKIENALDKDYSLNSGYNQDGISGLFTVKYAPK